MACRETVVTGGQDVQFLCHVYTVHRLCRLCRHFPHVSQDICSAPSSRAGRPTQEPELVVHGAGVGGLTQEPAVAVHGAGVGGLTQEPAVVVHVAGAGRPTLAVENSYAAMLCTGGGTPIMVLPVPPPPLCTMDCDSTRHIQKSRQPTSDHARIGTALSSNTEWGCTNLHTTGVHPCVYVMSLKADHGEP